MYIQRAGPNPTAVPPDAHQEVLSRNHLSGVLHQQQEQLVFFACERQLAGIEERELTGNIYLEMRVLVTKRQGACKYRLNIVRCGHVITPIVFWVHVPS